MPAEGSVSQREAVERLVLRLPFGVVGVSRDGVVRFANSRARHLFRPAVLEPGRPLPEPWAGLPLRPLVDRLHAYRTPLPPRIVALDDGLVVQVAGAAGEDGEPAVLVLQDVTLDYRQARAQVEFATNAAHQLRTPLAGIAGAVEALQGGAKENPADLERFLGHIQRETARLGRVTRALLVLARAHAGTQQPRLEPVALRPLLDEIAATLDTHPDVRVGVDAPPQLAALCERDLLHEALAALAENAARHTTAGAIRFRAREDESQLVEVEVLDTGEGIAPEHRARIFEPFYRGTAEGGGFGLGLAIAEQAAGAMGAELDVEAPAGGGTRFLLRLPSARVLR